MVRRWTGSGYNDNLNLDTQLKQRLTGAIILVVLVVLIVPALLQGPAAPPSRPAPATDAVPIRSYTIDLTGATPPQAGGVGATAMPSAPAPAPSNAPESAPPSPAAATPSDSIANKIAEHVDSAAATGTPPSAELGSGFAVQLGSFANHETVTRLTRELRAQGFTVSIVAVRAGGKALQRVRVGPVPDRAAAEALQQRLQAAGHRGPVVPFP